VNGERALRATVWWSVTSENMFKCIRSVGAMTRLRTEWPEHHSSILGTSKVIYLLQNFQNGLGTRLSMEYRWLPLG